jgi:LysM repeat protein
VFVKVTETLQLDVVTDVVAVEPTPTPTPAPTPTPTPTPAPTECPPGSTITIYYIQKGDTLFKLAQKYNTTVDAILALNPGIDPKNLQVGQRIKICVFKPLG